MGCNCGGSTTPRAVARQQAAREKAAAPAVSLDARNQPGYTWNGPQRPDRTAAPAK